MLPPSETPDTACIILPIITMNLQSLPEGIHRSEEKLLLDKLNYIGNFIGQTPVRELPHDQIRLFVKLEYNNYSGSIKDRAVYNILLNGIRSGVINSNTTIVESSSGNFAVSLASICKCLGLRSIVVIDPNINRSYEQILRRIATRVVKVSKRDATGGYLLTRLDMVEEICRQEEHIFWTNQYGNADNYLAYYNGLGIELNQAFDKLDYVFIGVSTGGTIAGISRRIKQKFPHVKVVAVDVEGSVIFGTPPAKRYISGLGSSKVPGMIKEAIIDQVIHVSEINVVRGCQELFDRYAIFGGGSTGAMYYAVKDFFAAAHPGNNHHVLFLCPDKGYPYMDTIYNEEWVNRTLLNAPVPVP